MRFSPARSNRGKHVSPTTDSAFQATGATVSTVPPVALIPIPGGCS